MTHAKGGHRVSGVACSTLLSAAHFGTIQTTVAGNQTWRDVVYGRPGEFGGLPRWLWPSGCCIRTGCDPSVSYQIEILTPARHRV